ncbi:MAG TPA: hypothetical protein VM487_02705 [Phycisphaerae bacterium]|nr:hypothetical protein [Phycisphaerae bacterium]
MDMTVDGKPAPPRYYASVASVRKLTRMRRDCEALAEEVQALQGALRMIANRDVEDGIHEAARVAQYAARHHIDSTRRLRTAGVDLLKRYSGAE